MSQRMAAGSNPRESHPCIPHAALLIACDALNARTLTVREYQPVCMATVFRSFGRYMGR